MEQVDQKDRVAEVERLIEIMRPAVQSDGGDLVLKAVDANNGVVEVELQGACSSCAISTSTIKLGVERILKSKLPWVHEVRGGVEEVDDLTFSASLGRGAYIPVRR
jgi:Fe-S cluster biogenesis protein NfuA